MRKMVTYFGSSAVIAEKLISFSNTEQLTAKPSDEGLAENRPTTREVLNITSQNAIELQVGVFIESDAIDIGEFNTSLLKTISEGIHRKRRIVLATCKALFLCCCNDMAVAY